MKRFLILGVAALAIAVAHVGQASAWINSNFGLGLNWKWQSGGNSALWGLWHEGQPCGPDIHPCGFGGGNGYGNGYAPGYAPAAPVAPGAAPCAPGAGRPYSAFRPAYSYQR